MYASFWASLRELEEGGSVPTDIELAELAEFADNDGTGYGANEDDEEAAPLILKFEDGAAELGKVDGALRLTNGLEAGADVDSASAFGFPKMFLLADSAVVGAMAGADGLKRFVEGCTKL